MFSPLEKRDLNQLRKSDGWSKGLHWRNYLQNGNEFSAFKLHVIGDTFIQGLIAVAIRDGYVELDLVEKAPSNRKPFVEFMNAGEVLFGEACLISINNGGEGFVKLRAKTGLLEHYIDHYDMQIINAKKRELAIDPVAANRLIGLYYNQRS